MGKEGVDNKDLFLTEDKGRKPVEPLPSALKAKAKAPANLAIYDDNGNLHPVVEHVLKLSRSAYSAYYNQRSALEEKWKLADEMYWMGLKDHRLSELTRAKVSASVFHRVVRRNQDGAYLATFTSDMPVKFAPSIGIFEDSEQKRRKAIVAEALNRVAECHMRKTDLKGKAYSAYHSLYKNGNCIAYVPYDFEVEKKKRWVTVDVSIPVSTEDGSLKYQNADTGEISDSPFPPKLVEEEYDYVCKDETGFHNIPLKDCYLDSRIKELNRQTCFLHRSDITRVEIWTQGESGKYKNIERITELQKFQLFGQDSGFENQVRSDAGQTVVDSMNSEMYERWMSWIMLPMIRVKHNKKGEAIDLEWDQNGKPRRYLMEVIGGLMGNNVVVRFQESPYWSNNIPYLGAHSHEDNIGFYGRGLVNLLEDNYIQETVAKGQLMDNRTLMLFRPMKRIVGRCKTKDMKIVPGKVFDLTSQEGLQEMAYSDFTGTISNTLSYLEEDSEKTAQTPPFTLGENMGSRTSATEFAAIRDSSSAPALNDIKRINMMLAGQYLKKVKEYAPQFLDQDVLIELMGDDGREAIAIIKADDFNADMYVEEVSVQEFENKATMRQMLTNLVQTVTNPIFAPFLNVPGLLSRIFQTFSSVFPNPEEIINKDPNIQLALDQYKSQKTLPSERTVGQVEAQPMQEVMGAAGGA